MKWINADQGTPEWKAARCGLVTASMLHTIQQRLKSGPNKGGYNAAAEAYASKIALQRLTGVLGDYEQFETWAMRRGKELEAQARAVHEQNIGQLIIQRGIAVTDCGRFGASPDGMIHPGIVAEYKCYTEPGKVEQIILGSYPMEEVIAQVQMAMWITDSPQAIFALYYPDLAIHGRELITRVIDRDEEYIDELVVKELEAFDQYINAKVQSMKGALGINTENV